MFSSKYYGYHTIKEYFLFYVMESIAQQKYHYINTDCMTQLITQRYIANRGKQLF